MLWVVHICVPIKLPSEMGGRLKIAIRKENSKKSEMFTKSYNSRNWNVERKAILEGLQ